MVTNDMMYAIEEYCGMYRDGTDCFDEMDMEDDPTTKDGTTGSHTTIAYANHQEYWYTHACRLVP